MRIPSTVLALSVAALAAAKDVGSQGHVHPLMRAQIAKTCDHTMAVVGSPSCESVADSQSIPLSAFETLNSWIDCAQPIAEPYVCLPSEAVLSAAAQGASGTAPDTAANPGAADGSGNGAAAGGAPTGNAGIKLGGANKPIFTGTMPARKSSSPAAATATAVATSAAASPSPSLSSSSTASPPSSSSAVTDSVTTTATTTTTDAVISTAASTTTTPAAAPTTQPAPPPSPGCDPNNLGSCVALTSSDAPPNVAGTGAQYECLTLTNYARQHYNPGVWDLYWDDQLAQYAQGSADYASANGCSECHTNSGPGTSWGQNLYLGPCSCTDAYNGWVTNEAAGNDPFNPDEGHFTNVVGFAVPYQKVGCASSSVGGQCATVCNYGL
ncbi:hypothetical protein BC830DRAFT_1158287 [Chytriomyces sp. MP71]|nr:hypothetical protein BC830DRAFT_1158287 [Chytriomyces sp. MP71]